MAFSQTKSNKRANTIRHVGFMGLGKLGLPCALACASKGHLICGYDPNPDVPTYIKDKKLPYKEIYSEDYLQEHSDKFISVGNTDQHLQKMVETCDIIFVPIQTPHDPKYEGVTRIPDDRVDFNYDFLKAGIKQLSQKIKQVCEGTNRTITVINISDAISLVFLSRTAFAEAIVFVALGEPPDTIVTKASALSNSCLILNISV